MAMPSAFGNGPQDLNSPVPDSAASNIPAAAPVKMAQPAAPASPQGGEPQQPQLSKGAALFEQELQKVQKGKGTPHDPFEDMDPNLPLGYTPLTSKLRKNPAGVIERLTKDGKWGPFSPEDESQIMHIFQTFQNLGLRTKEDIPRFVGAIAAGGIASKFGMGPFITAMISGLGQAAGGAAADVAQNKPVTAGGLATDVGVGAGASLIGHGLGSALGKASEFYGKEAAMAPLIGKGGEALQARFAEEGAAAQAIGATPGPSMTAMQVEAVKKMGPEAQKLYQMAWGKAAQFKESLGNLVSRAMGGYEEELSLSGEKQNFYSVIGNVMKQHGETITKYKNLAQTEAGGKIFEIDPVLSSTREQIQKMLPKGAAIFDDQGRINGKLLSEAKEKFPSLFTPAARELTQTYQELFNISKTGVSLNEPGAFIHSSNLDKTLRPVAGQSEAKILAASDAAMPRLMPGLTIDEMDAYRKAFGRKANFQALSRDEANDAYAQMHHSMSNHLDDKLIDALGKHPEAAQTLKASKEYYSSIKEMAEDLQAKLEKDPENAARALVDPKNPAQVKALWSMLKPKQQDYLAGGYLNTIMDPAIDEVTGRMKIISSENAWGKMDPKIKDMMYGSEGVKYVDSLINYAKGINLKTSISYNPENDPMMSKFLGLAHALNPHGAYKFFSGLFTKNPKAGDFVSSKLANILMPSAEDSGARQIFLEKASKTLLSKPFRGATVFGGADITSEHQPIPARLP